MADHTTLLTTDQITEAALTGWRQDGQSLVARFATGDFATGLALVDRLGAAAEEAGHHPDVLLTYPEVTVTLTSHDVGGVTSRDVDLARTTNAFADELGVPVADA